MNWVDYATAVRAASPLTFAEHVESLAAAGHQIYVVWAAGYQVFGVRCEGIVQTLQANPAYTPTEMVVADAKTFFQPMYLERFSPTGS